MRWKNTRKDSVRLKEINIDVKCYSEGKRIYDFLKSDLTLSSTLIKKVKFGGVFVNGNNVTMRAIVYKGDNVRVILPAETSENISAKPMPLDIIYEDEHFIALNKPTNMPTHPSKGNSLPTLAEGLCAYFSPEPFVFRAINRLDRDTSGIVLIAKDQLSADKLSKVMKSGGFIKKYEAIVCGTPNPPDGIIDAPIDRIAEGNIKRGVIDSGKRAITEYKVLKIYDDGNSLVELTLHTGRTHQIRVHMAHIGHPLKNDFLYGERGDESYKLHAKSLSFINPFTNEFQTILCPSGY